MLYILSLLISYYHDYLRKHDNYVALMGLLLMTMCFMGATFLMLLAHITTEVSFMLRFYAG